MEQLGLYLLVYFSSMFKFIFGPLFGVTLPFYITALLTAAGMMTIVFLFTNFLGDVFHKWIMRKFFKNKPKFSKRSRRVVKIWKRYGIRGIAFLTPLLLTPIGGTLIANSFGGHKRTLYFYMSLSALFWAFFFSYFWHELIDLFPFLHRK